MSIIVNTPITREKNVGAHDLYVKELAKYQLEDAFVDVYKLQIKKVLGNITKEQKNEGPLVRKELTELRTKRDKLEE